MTTSGSTTIAQLYYEDSVSQSTGVAIARKLDRLPCRGLVSVCKVYEVKMTGDRTDLLSRIYNCKLKDNSLA